MANFTRLDVRTVLDSLRVFCRENNIFIGVDDTDDRPSVYRYICYHQSSHMTCMIAINYEEVVYLDETIDTCLNYLREYFSL